MKKLPNVRRLFLPNPGHVLCDVDLSGADAQVVAWEAEDVDLKNAFRSGLDIHNHNGRSLWGDRYIPDLRPRKYEMRDELKRAVHGTNYVAGIRTLSRTLGWKESDTRSFQFQWFKLHPGIKIWHARTEYNLQTTRTVQNKFGYRRFYTDRPDNLLPKALAWGPQSTVAIVCSRALVRLSRGVPWVNVLLQVHDSIIFDVPTHRYNKSSFEIIYRHLEIPIPYDDPLIIPWGLKASPKNWGEVEKVKWSELQ